MIWFSFKERTIKGGRTEIFTSEIYSDGIRIIISDVSCKCYITSIKGSKVYSPSLQNNKRNLTYPQFKINQKIILKHSKKPLLKSTTEIRYLFHVMNDIYYDDER